MGNARVRVREGKWRGLVPASAPVKMLESESPRAKGGGGGRRAKKGEEKEKKKNVGSKKWKKKINKCQKRSRTSRNPSENCGVCERVCVRA